MYDYCIFIIYNNYHNVIYSKIYKKTCRLHKADMLGLLDISVGIIRDDCC